MHIQNTLYRVMETLILDGKKTPVAFHIIIMFIVKAQQKMCIFLCQKLSRNLKKRRIIFIVFQLAEELINQMYMSSFVKIRCFLFVKKKKINHFSSFLKILEDKVKPKSDKEKIIFLLTRKYSLY